MSKPRQKKQDSRYVCLWALMADPVLSASAKCVATAMLLWFQNAKDGKCNPSFIAIANVIGRGRRAVISAVDELKAAGWLTVESTKGGSATNTNRFRFNIVRSVGVTPTTPQGVKPTSLVRVSSATRVSSTAGGVSSTAHEPLKNHSPLRGEGERRACARAPDGAARQEVSGDYQQLRQLWERPHVEDEAKDAKAYLTALNGGVSHEDIMAGAQAWVAAGDGPRFLPPLWKWLADMAWLKEPLKPQRRHEQGSALDVALAQMAARRAAQ